MNKVIIVGNLTRDPESHVAPNGDVVVSFTVAVNRRTQAEHLEADFFRVSAWRTLGENCAKYLAKGRKALVIGSVRARAYSDQHGQLRASMDVNATEVEFLTPRGQQGDADVPAEAEAAATPVEVDDLPFRRRYGDGKCE